MFNRILAPVDLEHADRLAKAIGVTADLARHYGATVVFAAVTSNTPTAVAHNPQEFRRKLEDFAKEQGRKHGIAAEAKAYTAHDPAIQIDQTLLGAIRETGADLVVIGSHIPNVVDAIWPSHGGRIASHASVSVLVVR